MPLTNPAWMHWRHMTASRLAEQVAEAYPEPVRPQLVEVAPAIETPASTAITAREQTTTATTPDPTPAEQVRANVETVTSPVSPPVVAVPLPAPVPIPAAPPTPAPPPVVVQPARPLAPPPVPSPPAPTLPEDAGVTAAVTPDVLGAPGAEPPPSLDVVIPDAISPTLPPSGPAALPHPATELAPTAKVIQLPEVLIIGDPHANIDPLTPVDPPPAQDGTQAAADRAGVRAKAIELDLFLRSPQANFGVKNNPSAPVARFQEVAGLTVDGILGPDVREAGRQVGVEFPPRRNVPAHTVKATTEQKAIALGQIAATPTANTPQATAQQATQIAELQTSMGVTPTGKVDDATKQAAAMVGVDLASIAAPAVMEGTHSPYGRHACSEVAPAHLQPLFNALTEFAQYRPDYSLAKHFAGCRAGILAHIMRESGGRWGAVTKEAPRKGETAARYSYGPIQLLDDTARGLYKLKGVLGPHASNIKPISTTSVPTGEPTPDLKTSITSPSSGAWWIALFIAKMEDNLRRYFNLAEMTRTGLLTAVPTLAGSDLDAAHVVVSFVNDWTRKNPQTDPFATLLRLYGGASSLKGMANSITAGRAVTSHTAMLRHYPTAQVA
jgi:hypothetical protein